MHTHTEVDLIAWLSSNLEWLVGVPGEGHEWRAGRPPVLHLSPLVSAGFACRASLKQTKRAFILHHPVTIPHSVPSMATLLLAAAGGGRHFLPNWTCFRYRLHSHCSYHSQKDLVGFKLNLDHRKET